LTSRGHSLGDAEIRGESTVVRPAGESDVDLLVRWHADPDVSRYWDDETFTREQMLDRLRRPDVDAFVIEEDGEPVGYLQIWRTGDEGGLDMFLVPAARGRGLGPDAGRAVARYLRDQCGWRRVTVDPYLWNDAAVRAWMRAGFRALDEHDPDADHAARWLLMEFEG
jgi:aminoglycoside 6'-N-acetyltransferase